MSVRILTGDASTVLKTLPDESVHCVVTSPPYWGLRDYGTAKWEGGNQSCDHRSPTMREWRNEDRAKLAGSEATNAAQLLLAHRTGCGKCGAVKVDSQLGLEPTPQAYVENMVAVFREVRRVLRYDGTLWLNLGDTYCNSDKWGGGGVNTGKHTKSPDGSVPSWMAVRRKWADVPGIKPKDLVGVPWMIAFALRADGWYLRQDIIWAKPNPMPESVRDRCTKSHEYLFLLAKSERYYFDQTGIIEPCTSAYDTDDAKAPDGWDTGEGGHGTIHRLGREKGKSGNKARKPASARGVPVDTGGSTNGAVAGSVPWEGTSRNKRSVWTVTTQPFKEAHFATFPPALIEPCILAGCPVGGTVLDPFGGAGTTGLVADRCGRDAILVELNPAYVEMARKRIKDDAPMFAEVT